MTQLTSNTIVTSDAAWKVLYTAGGAAALASGVLFRRNIGPEVYLITRHAQPVTVSDWFALLQDNRFFGLAFLNFFDVVDYALLGLMFLALYAALKEVNKSGMAMAVPMALVAIAVYFASNPALSMLALSEQYTAATTEVQRAQALAAGQAVLAINTPGAVYHATGTFMSFLLLAAAGLLTSVVMLQSSIFSRTTAYVGILAALLDLAHCATFAFLPGLDVYLLSAAGLMLMIWHILTGLKLLQLARRG